MARAGAAGATATAARLARATRRGRGRETEPADEGAASPSVDGSRASDGAGAAAATTVARRGAPGATGRAVAVDWRRTGGTGGGSGVGGRRVASRGGNAAPGGRSRSRRGAVVDDRTRTRARKTHQAESGGQRRGHGRCEGKLADGAGRRAVGARMGCARSAERRVPYPLRRRIYRSVARRPPKRVCARARDGFSAENGRLPHLARSPRRRRRWRARIPRADRRLFPTYATGTPSIPLLHHV